VLRPEHDQCWTHQKDELLLMPEADLTAGAPRFLFFTGKGGVGKTSVACATAIRLADAGQRVLLVSTDPASNLDEVLATAIGSSAPTEIAGVPRLSALNLDPEQAARAYRERIVAPYRGLLPEASIRSIEEQLSGACTVEIAAFDEFSKLLGTLHPTRSFDHVVFDTAPTGHTLRLLELPGAWSGYLEANAGRGSCVGPLAGLAAQRELYEAARRTLADPRATLVVLVARPEAAALAEAERTRAELAALGVERHHLVLNGLFTPQDRTDLLAAGLEARGNAALGAIAPALARLPQTRFQLLPFALIGSKRLRSLGQRAVPPLEHAAAPPRLESAALDAVLDEISLAATGVVFTMGKGGVGKTRVAEQVALGLARRGKRVHLTTTDPAGAGSASSALARDGIRVSRIDAGAETARYVGEVMQAAEGQLDAAGRDLLAEELRSPCTEEVAVFRAFARTVAEGVDGFVVIDTAPTGHTLLLLDAAEAYHREVSRATGQVPEAVRELLPRLRNPDFAKVLLVTLPEATPVHEAAALQADLVRAGIRPFAWIVNQSLLPLVVTDPTLVARRTAEAPYLAEVAKLAPRFAVLPFSLQSDAHELSTTRSAPPGGVPAEANPA
jgi:arsenite/tail-anchored protein-transporting ATPase